ncbi:hypothetical protein [Archangium violaceum]|uniref:Uncharacterized protein n=1 Tax=Archangium violaceum Cb vi76 TaxID=1406225 RepID=A0A084SPW8_9BACT|nr:hypothetical protein [Archangium violaceum]KFA90503.1 hypothetical protein Q664_28065 [Archangium violaceum Cb vi76]
MRNKLKQRRDGRRNPCLERETVSRAVQAGPPGAKVLDEQHTSELSLEKKAVQKGPLGDGDFAEYVRDGG